MKFKCGTRLTVAWSFVGALACLGAMPTGAETNVGASGDPPSAGTAARVEMNTTDLLNLLVSEGVLTKDAALKLVNALRQRAELRAQGAGSEEPADDAVVVPYLPPHLVRQISDSIRQELAEEAVKQAREEGLQYPAWLDDVRVSGDVRVRYSGEFYPDDNPRYAAFDYNGVNDAGGTADAGRDAYLNVTDDRHRLQGRARLKITATPTANTEIGMRITSGDRGNPVSANQTLGRYGAKWESNFDLAYIKYSSNRLELNAGRFENPWLTSDLVWDRDMTFEGLFVEVVPFRVGSEPTGWEVYFNIGAFPLQEIHQFAREDDVLDAPDDKWLFSAGLGTNLTFGRDHELALALTYHDFENITGINNLPGQDSQDATAAPFLQWFNVTKNIAVSLPGGQQRELYGLAGEFTPLNLTSRYDYSGIGRYRLSVGLNFVQNLAWDAEEVTEAAVPGAEDLIPDRDVGYQIDMGFATQRQRERGDWGVSIAYRYLEGDAVVDAFADSDFLLGGTNAQGFIIKGHQYMSRNISLELTLISADEIDFPIGTEERDLREDAVLLDLYARF